MKSTEKGGRDETFWGWNFGELLNLHLSFQWWNFLKEKVFFSQPFSSNGSRFSSRFAMDPNDTYLIALIVARSDKNGRFAGFEVLLRFRPPQETSWNLDSLDDFGGLL